MKNKFQSNGLIRMLLGHSKDQSLGFPRHWKVIASTLLLLFTLGIGQMWGDETIYLFKGTSSNVEGANLNTADFFTTAEVKTNSTGAEIADKSSLTKYISLGNAGSSATNDPAKYIQYDCKTTSTQIEVYALNTNTNSGDRTVYWKHKKEGKTAFESNQSTAYNNSSKKSGKSDYTFTNETDSKAVNATVYIQVSDAKLHIYQVVVTEKGTPLKKVGDVGYSIGFATGKRPAIKSGTACRIDGFEILASSNFTPASTSEVALANANSNYIKFTLDEARKVTVKLNSNNKVFFAKSVKAVGTETQYGGSAGDYDAVLGAGTWYLQPVASSNPKVQAITFAAPPTTYTVTFNNNDHGGDAPAAQSGITSGGKATEPTEPEDASYNFGGWYNMEDWADPSAEKWNFGTSTVTKDTTLYAKWTDKSVPSTDATLSALSVAGCTFNETFASATTAYTVDLPFYASMPVVGDVTATKNDANAKTPVVSVEGNVITVACEAEDGTTKINYTITVTIATTPTASSSINIEQLVLDHGKKYDIAAAFAAAHIAYDKKGNTDELDSLKNQSGRNEPYLGLKMKKTDASITVVVPASSTLKVKFGNLPSAGIKVTINGVAQANHTSGNFELAATSAIREVVLAAPSTSTIVFKQIMVGENIQSVQLPWLVTYDAGEHGTCETAKETWKGIDLTLPTVTPESGWNFDGWKDDENNDATSPYKPTKDVTLIAQYSAQASPFDLTALTYQIGSAAAVNVGYEDGKYTYNVELPYAPSYDAITVAPTLKVGTSYLKGDEVLTVSSLPGAATFTVVEAGGANEKLYTVNFTKAPKDGTSIIKAVASATAQDITGANLTGAFKGAAHIETASSYKLNEDKYFMVQLVAGQNFQAGDIVKINVSAVNDCNGFTLYSSDEFTAANLIIDTHTNSDAVAKISAGINKVELPSSFLGSNKLYVARAHGADKYLNAGINQVEVTRVLNPQLVAITIDGADGDINEAAKTIELTLPYSSDLAALTVEPTIAWNEAAATNPIVVNDGGAWVLGPNTYKLTDKDGDATTYTITLTKAPHYEAQIGSTKYASLVAAVAAANADETVQLLDNVDLMATGLTIAENITLDLNGFNIKAGEQIDNDIVVPAGKKLTLVDNSANAEGKIYTEQAYTGAVTGYGLVRVAGELLMQSGNIYAVIESDPANLGQFAVVLGAGGKATIEGGQIKAGWYAISNNGNNTGSTIIVSGGELISTADFAIYNPAKESTVTVSGGVVYGAAGGIAMNRGELTVTGGTITSKDQGTTGTWGDGTGGLSNAAISASGKYESVEVEISGGTIIAEGTAVMITNGTTNPVEVAISGGQFSHVVPAEYCAAGFAPVTEPNAQGKYEVEDKRIYIFDGSTMSNMATSPSGAISWEIVGSTMGAGDKNKTYEGVHYTRALSCGNSSKTKHFKIDVALNNAAKIEVIGMSNSSDETRSAWLTNSTEKGDIADAIASLTSTGYNPEIFATDWLEEGSYYLHSDNTVAIFLIRVTAKAVDPKCEVPTITTQPATDLTFGAGNMTATVVAEVSDEGTLTYQWYNAANDEAVVGQTTATLTTADDGTYYVIVTNTKASHRDNSIKSAEATLAHRVMNDATLSALSYGGTAIALEADKYEYRVDLAMGTIDVPELTATATMAPYPTVVITNATEFVNYEATSTVVVTSEDGTATKTYTVKFVVDHVYTALVDVTESTTWNWSGSEDVTINDVANKGLILANYIDGANFEMIEGKENERARRNQNGGVYQGTHLHFNTTVAGKVKFYFRAPSSGENCTITVINNGKAMTAGTRGNSFGWSKEIVVKGDVVIEMVNDKEGGGDTRVQQIVFTELTPDYTRNVTNNIGTLCVDHNVLVGGAMGATFYQIASRNELYDYKIDFEEVLPNEELQAGKPYIFQSNTGKIELFYGTTAVTEPEAVRGMHGWFDAAAPIDPTKFMMLDITEVNKEDILYISSNKLWNCEDLVDDDLKVVNNRAYIVMSGVPTYADYVASQNSNNAPRRRVTLGKDEAQVVTGFGELETSETPVKVLINGQIFIIRGEKMFDATGRLVK